MGVILRSRATKNLFLLTCTSSERRTDTEDKADPSPAAQDDHTFANKKPKGMTFSASDSKVTEYQE